ncbi:MAG: CopG family transcriptional regulator [bacterium]|nr:CopG family transcriptional regulator [bacterium]
MTSSINLSLTDELRTFVDQSTGDGTLYATPSEFLRDLLREKKRRLEAAALRDAVLEGYQDLIEGRSIRFSGDVRDVITQAKRREAEGW